MLSIESEMNIQYTELTNATPDIPLHLPKRERLFSGDTRRRKQRLQKKLEKQDRLKYATVICMMAKKMKRKITEKIEHDIIYGTDNIHCRNCLHSNCAYNIYGTLRG